MEWEISDQDIESTEKLLLPEGAHFPEDARNVIRCWHSIDVAACPGSGKTTVLLAKLKLLVDRMPLENGAGICVLSHTNVAVNEIRKRLSGYSDRLLSYPNYIGTIQSFVDKFVTMPYLRNITGRNVQAVDDHTYAQHMLTLYLETDRQGASDLNRILPYFGVGKLGSSNLFDYSRKLAYVGMSRPKKLLCVAMQAKTYEKSEGVFADDWEIIDLRE